MKKYTVIIMFSNNEKNISRCLDNVISTKYNDYDIIILNNSCKDRASNIVKKYLIKYSNIKYYCTNFSTYESTLDWIINKIDSKYFMILDANDLISPTLFDSVDSLIISENEFDIISFKYKNVKYYDNFNILEKCNKSTFNICSGKDAYVQFCENTIHTFSHYFGYFYKTDFIKKINFKFSLNTELVNMTQILLNANFVISLDVNGYIRNKNYYNITSFYEIDKLLDDYIKINEEVYKCISSYDDIEIVFNSIIMSCLNISTLIKDKRIFNYFVSQIKRKRIYKFIPKIAIEKRVQRVFLYLIPIIPVIYYLTFIYFGEYIISDIYMNRYFSWIREVTHEKFKKILQIKNYRLLRIKRNTFFLYSIIKNLPILLNKKDIYINYFELPITTKCTLKCRDCANLIPYYSSKKCSYNVDVTYIEKQVKQLFKVVHSISTFRVLGGEPFVHPDLGQVMKILINTHKIKNKIIIVTNGTIIPNGELIKILKNKKVEICISNYGKFSYNRDKLIDICNSNGISWTISTHDVNSNDYFWIDFGVPTKSNKTNNELINQFKNCDHNTKTLNLINGKIYLCSHCAYAADLKLIDSNIHDYLDIMNSNIPIKEKKDKLNKLIYTTKYIDACKYCNIGTKHAKKIKVATQKEGEKNEAKV